MANAGSPTYPPSTWRLVLHDEADGATNMAIDEAILTAVVEGASPATLRLYAWSPPCLSLGRSQSLSDANLAACRAVGVDIVRRPTGGRAILHTDELTYCVAAAASEPRVSGGVLEVYHRLTDGLLCALHSLGIAAEEAGTRPAGEAATSAACFRVPSAHEIVLSGRKLLASAQCRQAGWVLQHGSLPLRGDVGRIAEVLAVASDDERDALRSALHTRSTTVAAVLGSEQSFEDLAASLAEIWAHTLQVAWQHGDLSPWERARATELREAKYADRAWTERR